MHRIKFAVYSFLHSWWVRIYHRFFDFSMFNGLLWVTDEPYSSRIISLCLAIYFNWLGNLRFTFTENLVNQGKKN